MSHYWEFIVKNHLFKMIVNVKRTYRFTEGHL